MFALTLAAVDWPFAVLALLVIVFIFARPAFRKTTSVRDHENLPAIPAWPLHPTAPVVSKVAGAAWPLAVCAMIPVVGWVPGIALAVLAVLLLVKRRPLRHDRRVGWAALGLALVSIAFPLSTVAGVFSLTNRGAGQTMRTEQQAESATIPTTRKSEPQAQSSQETPLANDQRPQPQSLSASQPATASAEEMEPEPFEINIPWSIRILYLAVLVVSIVFHEVGHAVAAFWSGDTTARDRGRISLNPLRHIDWIGSVIVPVVLILLPGNAVIGWAKPVPIRRDRFRNPRSGLLGVTLAGVSLNLFLALLATNILVVIFILIRWAYPQAIFLDVITPFAPPLLTNISHPVLWAGAIAACNAFLWINALLMGFNLLPVPPLDGFGVLQSIAPRFLAPLLTRFMGLGMLGLLIVIAFDLLTYLLLPAIVFAALLAGYAGIFVWGL